MKRYRPAKNYLDYLPVPTASFITPVVQGEMDRLSSRQPMETLSMKRYCVEFMSENVIACMHACLCPQLVHQFITDDSGIYFLLITLMYQLYIRCVIVIHMVWV